MEDIKNLISTTGTLYFGEKKLIGIVFSTLVEKEGLATITAKAQNNGGEKAKAFYKDNSNLASAKFNVINTPQNKAFYKDLIEQSNKRPFRHLEKGVLKFNMAESMVSGNLEATNSADGEFQIDIV